MAVDKSNIFASLIETHKGIIYKIAHSYCSTEDARKDLIQEILLQLWKSFDSYNDQYKYSTWIYRIALNVSISFYRKEKSREKISNAFTKDIFKIEEQKQSDMKEDILLLQRFIDGLKPLDKALLLLYLEKKAIKKYPTSWVLRKPMRQPESTGSKMY